MSTIGDIENDIVARLKTPLDAKTKEIATRPGAWSIDLLQRVLQRAPAIYVSFLGGTPRKGEHEAIFDARFDVYAVSRRINDDLQARQGNQRMIGAYDMLETSIKTLHGQTLADVGTYQLQSIENLFGDAMFQLGGVIFAATFLLPGLTIPSDLDLSTLDAFVTFDEQYDIDTTQNGEPVAEDTITLPQ